MPPIPYRVSRADHPGSSKEDIENEPDWTKAHPNRIGYRNRWDRSTGLIHGGDESDDDDEMGKANPDFLKQAEKQEQELREKVQNHEGFVNFREAIEKQEVRQAISHRSYLQDETMLTPSVTGLLVAQT